MCSIIIRRYVRSPCICKYCFRMLLMIHAWRFYFTQVFVCLVSNHWRLCNASSCIHFEDNMGKSSLKKEDALIIDDQASVHYYS